jgi:hypothetical protein
MIALSQSCQSLTYSSILKIEVRAHDIIKVTQHLTPSLDPVIEVEPFNPA